MSTKDKKASIRIDPALVPQINILAAAKGVPAYQIVEMAVKAYIKAKKLGLIDDWMKNEDWVFSSVEHDEKEEVFTRKKK